MKRWHVALLLFMVGLSIILVMAVGESMRQDQEMTPLTVSPRDSGRGGGRALWLLCKQRGAHLQETRDITRLPTRGVTIWRDGEGTQVDNLLTWVRDGGSLVVLPTTPDSELLRALGVQWRSGTGENRPELVVWQERHIAVRNLGGRLKVVKRGVDVLNAAGGTVLSRIEMGAGKIWILADPWGLSNEGLDVASNGDFALWLLDVGPHCNVTYAEPPSINRGLAAAVFGSVEMRRTFWLLLMLTILYLLSANVPFGRLVIPVARRERSELEYVAALGAIYASSGDAGLPLDGCYRWICLRTARCLRLSGLSTLSSVTQLIEQRYRLQDVATVVCAVEYDRESVNLTTGRALKDIQAMQNLFGPIHKESLL